MNIIESVARVICQAEGINPDSRVSYSTIGGDVFQWQKKVPQAKAAINAIIEAEWPDSGLVALGGTVSRDELISNAKALLKQAVEE